MKYLDPDSTKQWPPIAVFDIEAERWVDVTLVCHVDEHGNRVGFTSVSLYLDWVFSDEFPSDHVWAHWGGHYDFRFLLVEGAARGYAMEAAMSGAQIVVLSMKNTAGRTIRFCDCARLMPDALAKIGKAVGLPKLDVDRTKIEKLSAAELREYCFRDCDIALKGIHSMRDSLLGVGCDFAYTLASITSRWVRMSGVVNFERFYHVRLKKRVYREDIQHADAFCSQAYFGGRVEVFKKGRFEGPLYYYDVRSSYPWSMTHPLPLYFYGYYPFPEKCNVKQFLAHTGITECEVDIPSTLHLPILPIYHEHKLLFPTGTLRGRWTNIELRAAIERGCTVRPIIQARYEAVPFLRPFVDRFYKLRRAALESGDGFRQYAYKIALNSLYGKLSESLEKSSIVTGPAIAHAIRLHGEKNVFPTNVSGVFRVVSEREGPFRHVAAGAYVTARSRLKLLEGLEAAMKAGGEVYYCDTDSIVTNVELAHGTGTELGDWNHEATLKWGEFLAPKVYRYETTSGKIEYRCKGIPIRGISDDESQLRFEHYIAGIDVEKDGLGGLIGDLKQGTLRPVPRLLTRALRKQDSKRVHLNGRSTPVELFQ